MKRAKRIFGLIALTVIVAISALGLAACGKASIDLSGYVKVTYDCMGGNIDKLPTRELYAKPGSAIVEPKGSIGLVEARRVNYTLVGWYTAHGEGTYTLSTDGDLVDYFTFEPAADGEYVGYAYYYEDATGAYVAQDAPGGGVIYVLYDPSDPAEGARYSMIERYEPYDVANPDHEGKDRFSATAAYVLYDAANPDHAGLDRYLASYTWDETNKWDFATSRVGEEDITLYARWVYNLKIFWDYQDGGTIQPYENGQLGVEINRGEVIPQTELIPKKAGYTFTYWYKEPSCENRWNFATDVFPTDESVTSLTLYAGFVEGEYARVTNAKTFREKIVDNLSAKLLIINDINLGENPFNFSNGRIKDQAGVLRPSGGTFTGEINGLGNVISGVLINVRDTEQSTAEKTIYEYAGLFGHTENAVIKDVTIKGRIVIKAGSKNDLYIGTAAGHDKGGSKFLRVSTDFTVETETGGATSNVFISGGVASKKVGENATVITDCVFADANVLKDGVITTGTITVLS